MTGRRLRDALDPASGWEEVTATSSAVTMFGGAVSIDEMWFPAGGHYGLSLRLWDPAARTWTVRWVTSRGGGLQPPAEGVWQDGRCWLTGPGEYRGQKVLAGSGWSQVTASGARWEQCFSTDGGHRWQPNSIMQFTRRRDPAQHPQHPRVADDFDFLTGTWNVHHRRLLDPVGHAVGGGSDSAEFDGVHTGWTWFAGAVSVDETTLAEPGQRGLTFRVYEPALRQWSIYWVNSRRGRLEPPVHGRFANGTGTFFGTEELAGRQVQVRFVWSGITPATARWVQSFRVDGGEWDDNWVMDFTRPATADAR